MTGRRFAPRLVYLVFFLSGAASLANEVVWFKWLNLIFGSTTAAAATLLAVFMGGLAAGSAFCSRFAPRLVRPQWLYAVLESGVAVYAIATPLLFSGIDSGYVWAYRHVGESANALLVIRILLSAAALLPPTFLMGATFPALSKIVESRQVPGSRSALLYGVNTAGALVGTAACGFWLIPAIGLQATLWASATTSLIAALAATTMRSTPSQPPAAPRRSSSSYRLWIAAAVTGGAAMADEVIWTRVLVLRLGSSVYAFSLMLALYLAGLVLGSLAGSRIRRQETIRAVSFAQVALAATLFLQVWGFSFYTRTLVSIATVWLHAGTWAGLMASEALTTALYLLPPTFWMGYTFALLVRAASGEDREEPAQAGAIYAANTVGAIVGSLAAGFLAIPVLGSQVSLLATGFLATAVAVWLWPRAAWARVAPVLFVPLAFLPARDSVILTAGSFADVPRNDVVYYDEDVTGTIAVKRYRAGEKVALSLELNGVNVAGTTPDLIVIQKLQGHLPLLLAARPRRVVHIGLGSGGTAYSVSRHSVSSIRIVEISPEVVRTADRFFPGVNHGVLKDPRVRVTINDGRNFLLATRESFDAILSDSIHPRYAGNGSLYTEDYFRLCARRLAPGGVISMWLPMYSLRPEDFRGIVRAFRDVFPNVSIWYPHSVWNSFTIVLATPNKTVSLGDLRDRMHEPSVREDLARIGADDPAELLSYLLLSPDDVSRWVAETPPHVDDRPTVEYESGRVMAQNGTWAATFADLVGRRSRIQSFVAGLAPDDPESRRVLERFQASQTVLEQHRADVIDLARREP
ncbi:MAG TPA: fused MFS/spermidine synthase [Thermoanaerobaculia bacterium]